MNPLDAPLEPVEIATPISWRIAAVFSALAVLAAVTTATSVRLPTSVSMPGEAVWLAGIDRNASHRTIAPDRGMVSTIDGAASDRRELLALVAVPTSYIRLLTSGRPVQVKFERPGSPTSTADGVIMRASRSADAAWPTVQIADERYVLSISLVDGTVPTLPANDREVSRQRITVRIDTGRRTPLQSAIAPLLAAKEP